MIQFLWLWSIGEATPGDVGFMIVANFIMRGYLRDIGQNIRDLQQAVNDLDGVALDINCALHGRADAGNDNFLDLVA